MEIIKSIRPSVIDTDNRLLWGWAWVSAIRDDDTGEFKAYRDPDGDYISEDVIMKAATSFMKGDPIMIDYHGWNGSKRTIGRIIHSFPVTEDHVKSGLINTDKLGWLTGSEVEKSIFDRFLLPDDDKNKYRSLSIGFKIGAVA